MLNYKISLKVTNVSKYSVVILAAGTSSRFGQNKAFLRWNSEMNFLEKIVSTYSESGINNGFIVVNNDTFNELKQYNISRFKGFNIIVNYFPDKGRLYSLKLAVEKMNDCKYCFIQNIDNPFVSSELISELLNKIENNNYLVPSFEGKNGHPALVNDIILKTILNTNYNVGIKEVLSNFDKKIINFNDKTILYNINTDEEYKSIFKFVE